ncbi:MAG: hypothetical protein JXA42_17610 [Anaerolineales bacterium]|nr:hypothetical protein [Anaerolineales bacterium]
MNLARILLTFPISHRYERKGKMDIYALILLIPVVLITAGAVLCIAEAESNKRDFQEDLDRRMDQVVKTGGSNTFASY